MPKESHTFQLRSIPKNAKKKFLLFTCRRSHFSLAKGSKKCQRKVCSFHLQGGVTLFTCGASGKMPRERSHFSLAIGPKKCQKKFALFTYRGSPFSLANGSKKCRKKFALFTYRGSQFSLVNGSKKCQKKIRIFHLQGVILFTFKGFKKMPKENSHVSLVGGHTFHLQWVQKNVKRKFTLFTYRVSHFSLAKGSKKCQKKVRTSDA